MKKAFAFVLCITLLFCGCDGVKSSMSDSSSIEPESLTAAGQSWWRNLMSNTIWDEEQTYITIHRDSDYSSVNGDCVFNTAGQGCDFTLIINTAQETANLSKQLTDYSYFLINTPDNQQYKGKFYQKGISLAKPDGTEVLLSIKDNDYNFIFSNLKKSFDTDKLNISALTGINYKDCKSIKVTAADKVTQKTYDDVKMGLEMVVSELGYIEIVPRATKTVDKDTQLQDAASAHIELTDGSYYDVQCNMETLIITSSDSENAISYQLYNEYTQNTLGTFNSMANGSLNPRT